MAYKYTAGKPEQKTFGPLKPGEYNFQVAEATQERSLSKNKMIKLKLRVLNEDGTLGKTVYDYLVFTENSFFKIDNFLKSCGKHPGEGEEIELDVDDMIGWEGRAYLRINKHEGREDNKVGAYVFEDEDDFA